MHTLLSSAVALASLPAMAAGGSGVVVVESKPAINWFRQIGRSDPKSALRKYGTSFEVNSTQYEVSAEISNASSGPSCVIRKIGSSVVSNQTVGIGDSIVTPEFQSEARLGHYFGSEVVDNALVNDAAKFTKAIEDLTWRPSVWSDDGEIVFEWISNDRHAVASIEGDGIIGYTMRHGEQFVSGMIDDATVDQVPADLLEYLTNLA